MPAMYWLPKLHGEPCMARYVAGLGSCAAGLSRLLTDCLAAVGAQVMKP